MNKWKKKEETFYIKDFLNCQKYNSMRYSLEEIFEAAADPVIFHYFD